jgi:long-chain fatty acid transport protein
VGLSVLAGTMLLTTTAHASTGPAQSALTAPANSAVTAASNPAGLARLKQSEWVVQLLAFSTDSTFVTTADSYSGVTKEDSSGSLVIPSLFYARPISERMGFGFSITIPGGLGEDLDDDGPQRYLLDEWSLGYVSFAPAIGYRLNERWSLGAGLNINYSVLQYESAVFNFDPTIGDGKMEIEASDLTLGFQLGLLYELTDRTRIGVGYRSENDPKLSDTPDFSNLGPLRQQLLDQVGILNQKITLDSQFPQIITAGLYHQFANDVELTVDVAWIDFSEYGFSDVRLGSQSLTTTPTEYEDIWAVSAGVSWPVKDRWQLKFGAVYASSGVEDENRTFTLRLDEIWGVGVGAEYQWRDDRMLGANLNYYEIGDGPTETNVPLLGKLAGEFSKREAIGIDFTFRWLR